MDFPTSQSPVTDLMFLHGESAVGHIVYPGEAAAALLQLVIQLFLFDLMISV